MQFFQPYLPPKSLPPLAPSRTTILNRLIRTLEGNPGQHILVEGKLGSGRATLLAHVLALGPSLKRSHRFRLDAEQLVSRLFEAVDPEPLLSEVSQFAAKHPRSLMIVEHPSSLADIADKTEERRLVRLLRELAQRDLRILMAVEQDTVLRLPAAVRRRCEVISLPPLASQEIETILASHHVSQGSELTALAQRFFPSESLPGSAIRLWQQASQLARQQSEEPALQHVYLYISEQRGIPVEAIAGTPGEAVAKLADDIRRELVGQEHAVRTVTRVLNRAYAGFRNEHKPVASFLFLGPSGVGKTELAKIMSRRLYQDQTAFHRIDMSEFSESHTVQRLIGAPPGYVGFEEGGQLTNPVDREPYSLVLLDEIEKAHPKVFDIFLQLLDDGRLTDGRGKTVDFTHTTIVATSNIGLREIVAASESDGFDDHERFLTTKLLPILLTHFRPEFLNRFDAIIVFQPLTIQSLKTICERDIHKLRTRLTANHITLTVRQETIDLLCRQAYQPTFGARPLKRLIEDRIESVLAERIIRRELTHGTTVTF